MKNIETTNYVNHIFLNKSSYKTFRDNYEFDNPNKVRWNGIPIPFLDIILDCGVDIVDIIIDKGIELDSGEFIDCDTSDLEDTYNAINRFKESKKENQQDDIYFVKYVKPNSESNIVHGGILRMSLNGTYANLSADFDLTFDPDHDNIIEAIKLDDTLSALIRFIIKYSSNDEPMPNIPKEVKNNNEYNDISDQLKNVKDFNCTSFKKEDKDTITTVTFNEYSDPYDDNPFLLMLSKSPKDIKAELAKRNISKQIPENDDITASITPEEVKDIGDNYDITQVIKHMSMIKDYYFRKQLYFRRLTEDLRDTFEEPTEKDEFNPSLTVGYLPIVPKHYIDLNNDDLEYGSVFYNKDWKYIIRYCHESDTFIINATGGEETRAYAFVDKDCHILQKAELNEVCDMKEVTAPKGSICIIVNSKNAPLNVIKKL